MTSLLIKCRKCGYEWEANPAMWKQAPKGTKKLLKCPYCYNWNELNIGETEVAIIQEDLKKEVSSDGSETVLQKKNSISEPQKPSVAPDLIIQENLANSRRKTPDTSELTKILKALEEKP